VVTARMLNTFFMGWILDARCLMLDSRCWLLDEGGGMRDSSGGMDVCVMVLLPVGLASVRLVGWLLVRRFTGVAHRALS